MMTIGRGNLPWHIRTSTRHVTLNVFWVSTLPLTSNCTHLHVPTVKPLWKRSFACISSAMFDHFKSRNEIKIENVCYIWARGTKSPLSCIYPVQKRLHTALCMINYFSLKNLYPNTKLRKPLTVYRYCYSNSLFTKH